MQLWARLACLGMAGGLAGACATPPPPPDAQAEPERPFIKLAKREMALLLAWRGAPPSAGDQEVLERLLVARLRSAYRVSIESHLENGPYTGLSPQLFLGLVERGIDDVVIIEAELDRKTGALQGTVQIVVLDDQRVIRRLTLAPTTGKGLDGAAHRFADLAYLQISRSWRDPGAEPELNPLRAANFLADRNACDHAVPLFEKILATERPKTFDEIQRYGDADRRYQNCQRLVAERDLAQKDKTAVFALSLGAAGVSEAIQQAFASGLARSSFETKLGRYTDKPARIELRPGLLTLVMRYHAERYQAATKDRSPFFGGQPAVWVEPFTEPMLLLAELRDQATDRLGISDRTEIAQTHLQLRLERLPGDFVELDFADLDGRALVLDEARIKVGARGPVALRSAVPQVAQTGAFVLGVLETATGELTPAGLAYRFFDLQGPHPARPY